MFDDRDLTCADCGETFLFTSREQEFYSSRGFSDPKRCKDCRDKRKAKQGGGGGGGGGGGRPRDGGGGGGGRPPRELFDAVCASCGQETQVPFKPRGDRPVYCRDCFRSR